MKASKENILKRFNEYSYEKTATTAIPPPIPMFGANPGILFHY